MWIESQDGMEIVKCNDFSYGYNRRANQYEVFVNGKVVGYYRTLEDARKVFNDIRNGIYDGNFMFSIPRDVL